jgi:tetratricopeptide (TPR) repeat protein
MELIMKKIIAVLFAAIMLLSAASCSIKSKGDKLAEDGAKAYGAGDYQTALEKFKAAEETGLKGYNSIELKQFLGSTYLKLGDPDNAIRYYRQVADANSYEMTPWLNLGVAQKTAGLFDEALESYKTAEQYDTGTKSAALLYVSMGSLYIEKNDPINAIDVLEKATERNPDFPDSYAYLAIAYAQMYDFTKSDENYQKAADLGYTSLDAIKTQVDKFRN